MPTAAAVSEVDRVSLPSRSMFVSTPIYSLLDGTLVFGLRQPPVLPAAGDESLLVTEAAENRLDLLSHRLYGNSSAWWAIADVSGILDPLAGVPAGTVLRAPAQQRLPS